jgi:hypothetical protein
MSAVEDAVEELDSRGDKKYEFVTVPQLVAAIRGK